MAPAPRRGDPAGRPDRPSIRPARPPRPQRPAVPTPPGEQRLVILADVLDQLALAPLRTADLRRVQPIDATGVFSRDQRTASSSFVALSVPFRGEIEPDVLRAVPALRGIYLSYDWRSCCSCCLTSFSCGSTSGSWLRRVYSSTDFSSASRVADVRLEMLLAAFAVYSDMIVA
jgi:hypothetical protein